MSATFTELSLLEELRSIAQLGLNYTRDSFDKERYERLLVLAVREYARLSDLTPSLVIERFRSELGHVTPKVGVNGAIFDDSGRMFLAQRSDDLKWELPGGWADLNESPRAALIREFQEELSLEITAGDLIEVVHRLPGDFSQPHTTYHLIFRCKIVNGEPRQSSETLNFGYFSEGDSIDWHCDHEIMAAHAWRFEQKKR